MPSAAGTPHKKGESSRAVDRTLRQAAIIGELVFDEAVRVFGVVKTPVESAKRVFRTRRCLRLKRGGRRRRHFLGRSGVVFQGRRGLFDRCPGLKRWLPQEPSRRRAEIIIIIDRRTESDGTPQGGVVFGTSCPRHLAVGEGPYSGPGEFPVKVSFSGHSFFPSSFDRVGQCRFGRRECFGKMRYTGALPPEFFDV